jgi:hypothetical protein
VGGAGGLDADAGACQAAQAVCAASILLACAQHIWLMSCAAHHTVALRKAHAALQVTGVR